MKRFIDLGDQTSGADGVKEFAFFDTVKDKFETFNGEMCWNSIKDFANDYDDETEDIQRYLNLIPEDYDDSTFIVELTEAEIELEKIRPNTYFEPIALADLETDLIKSVKDRNYKLAHYIAAKMDFITSQKPH